MKRLITLVIMIRFLSAPWTIAQSKGWNIVLATKDTIFQATLKEVSGDSLFIEHGGISEGIPVETIEKMILVKKSAFWLSAGIGLLTGAVVGTAIGSATDTGGGGGSFDYSGLGTAVGAVIGAVGGLLVGGVIGAVVGMDKEVDLSETRIEDRIIRIRELINQ